MVQELALKVAQDKTLTLQLALHQVPAQVLVMKELGWYGAPVL